MSDQLRHRLRSALAQVAGAAHDAGRDPAEVAVLLAVKTRSDDEVLAALDLLDELQDPRAARLLGHNRVQEMVAQGPALAGETRAEPVPTHQMHLIGPLQSNKINHTLRWATSVDTVGAVELAEKLDAAVQRHRADGRWPRERTLQVMVQVNTSGEDSKFGCAPAKAGALARAVGELPHLDLRGFFTIGARSTQDARVRASFTDLRDIRDEVLTSGAPGTGEARELSMGMSSDLELAIDCGATQVRLGTAVFGPRS